MSRQHSTLGMVLRNAPLMSLLACSNLTPQGPLAQFCPSDQTPGSGNVDRPTSVAIAVQGGSDGTAYAVVANPDLRQARAINLTEGRMVPAPNQYFPMAVKLGTYTEDLAVSDDGQVGVALDASDHELRFFTIGAVTDKSTWKTTVWERVGVDFDPTGLAVHGTRDDLLIVISHAGDPVGSLTLLRWNNGTVTDQKRLDLGGRPSSVGLVEDGSVAVVGNAADNGVWVVETALPDPLPVMPFPACAPGVPRPCTVDVLGPVVDVAVGSAPYIPFGARYPVALALRRDAPAIAVVRLQVHGSEVPEEPVDRLDAVVFTPRPPAAAALAPNPAPLCCTGQAFVDHPEALAGGGFAYGVVALMDGTIMYLDLNAEDATGRRTPRLIDRNPRPPAPTDDATGEPLDVNTAASTYQEPGMDPGMATDPSRRPRFDIQVLGDVTGTPPVVMQNLGDDYRFTFEGPLPGTAGRWAKSDATLLLDGVVQDTHPGFDLAEQGVRPGDWLEIRAEGGACPCPLENPECAVWATLPITSVNGPTLHLGQVPTEHACLLAEQGFQYAVRAREAFTVVGLLSETWFGRVGFFEFLHLPGLRVAVAPGNWEGDIAAEVLARQSSVGNTPSTVVPVVGPPRDTVLTIPMRSNFDPFRLELDDAAPDIGRMMNAGVVPTGLTTAVIPVIYGSTGSQKRYQKAVGILSTGGGGLVLQFDLAVHGTGTNGEISRSNSTRDSSFRFFE